MVHHPPLLSPSPHPHQMHPPQLPPTFLLVMLDTAASAYLLAEVHTVNIRSKLHTANVTLASSQYLAPPGVPLPPAPSPPAPSPPAGGESSSSGM